MDEATVTLKKGEGRMLKSGGMWIFDNEIAGISGDFENGGILRVEDWNGYPMGRGFVNLNSRIRVRMMTRRPDQAIDRDFLRARVQAAWEYRKKTVDLSSCRIIFGEADFLPGLVVDKYAGVLVGPVAGAGNRPDEAGNYPRCSGKSSRATGWKSAAFLSAAMQRCACRKGWSGIRASSDRNLTPRWK